MKKLYGFVVTWAKTPAGKKIEAALFKAAIALIAAKLGLDLSK